MADDGVQQMTPGIYKGSPSSLAGDFGIGDYRVEIVADYLLRNYRMKPDRWVKFYNNPENQSALIQFWDNPEKDVLIFFPSGSQLEFDTKWPTEQPKEKFSYFIKRNKSAKITKDNFREEIFYGDLFPSMMEHLSSFLTGIVKSIVTNQCNNHRWPTVVTDDVLYHIDNLKTTIDVTLSKVKGHTILKIPSELQNFEASKVSVSKNYVHAIESVIVGWSNDIQEVLKVRVSDPLLEGKNPTPAHEIKYWDLRAKDLDRIYQQLVSPSVKAMVFYIRDRKSVYYQVFKDLYSSVVKALAEAVDNNVYMVALHHALDNVENAEFEQYHRYIGPLIWTVCAIWIHSDFYNTPERITVLLQELCNFIIELVESSVNPEDMFKGEIADAISGVKVTEHIMATFLLEINHYKRMLPDMFPPGAKIRPWNFNMDIVFGRFNKVHERLKIAIYIMDTDINFMKLEKVDFGGIRGNMLGEQVQVIFTEFDDAFKLFTDCKYNPLNTNDDSFLRDFKKFNYIMSDFERRLGTIVCMGFHDCSSLESVFKLMDIMGPLLERELIKKDFDTKYPVVVSDMHEALDICFALYEKQMETKRTTGRMVVHKNMPQMAGAMMWAKEVYQRVSLYMSKYLRIDNEIRRTAYFKEVSIRASQLRDLLNEVDESYFTEWISRVDELCSRNMEQPLLKINPETKLISVNFGNELVAILREVKYLSIRNVEHIPSKPEDIYSRRDLLFKYYANLMVISDLYNRLITDTLDVEKPLIAYGLSEIDKQLEPAANNLTWDRKDLSDYIMESRELVKDLKDRVVTTQANVSKIENIISQWAVYPLFERKEKQDNLLGLTDRADIVRKRHQEIVLAGVQIHDWMAENMQLFNADENSEAWINYVKYLDQKVKDGFSHVIACSLNYLLENTSERTCGPLFEIIMELNAPKITFTPELDMGSVPAKLFWDVIDLLAHDIYNQASIIHRLTGEDASYEELLEQSPDLRVMKDSLVDKIDSGIACVLDWRDVLNKYSALWVDNRDEKMAMFLKYNHFITDEEIAMAGEEGIPESPPTLPQFKEKIDFYEHIFEEIESLQAVNIFNKWLRVDGRKFKDGLLKEVTRWSKMFKQHLIDRVTNSLDELQDFIKSTMHGLSKDPTEGEFDRLVQCMELLNAVRNRQATTDTMFDPIKETIELLKTCGVEMSDKVYTQLEELPDKWTSVKKRVLSMKQTVVPLQNNEMAKLRRKAVSFDVKQHLFRDAFRSCPAFFFNCKNSYRILNEYNEQIEDLEEAMRELQEACDVFDVALPDFKQLRTCRFELKLLKILWDYVTMVDYLFDFWKQILWIEIDVEQMDIDCKKLTKELRSLDKEMRAWDVYTGLEAQLKNMMTSLRAVGELQNSAIRERHWAELMNVTKVAFSMNEETCLDDLLKLNLHKFEDDVHGIVDKAVKETSMEKTLRELSVTWATMAFIHETHLRTGTTLLIAEEELIETLEDNQVQLQNMMTSKYIAHFLEEVSDWTQKLSTTDQVISIYMEVQRTWTHLESIFIGSDDIRKQLPEETDRFQRTDTDFKELVKDISVTKIVVDACTIPGLFERLEAIQKELTICEKALAEYLETKRLAFPRFYFVSSADLLDILSNGNSPAIVSRQLTKLFDNMAKLELEKSGKVGTGMYSKEMEFVQTENKIDLSGQVEIWLNRVQDAMRSTVRFEMEKAVHSYEDKPRDKWLFDYPAQVALCGTQIWWAAEVTVALHKLEEGYEPALKDYLKKQINQLNALISHLLGDLTPGNRQKIMTICTIDVHARDVVAKMIAQKVDNGQCFVWLSQLRHRWDNKDHDCFANICDAQFRYDKEYLGNTPRLVITPLTDRCYITLTQSLHLIMGGAPAGPAGTGKTETTKDLGRALGIMVYVFNCSEQMDYKSIGNIFKGLSQQGAWGCFDEFNRISVEVLSVVAVQVKSIQDAIKEKKKKFNFMGELIKLVPTVGAFITMNPGYAGRAELPENLKALFRPCAMVVPDFELICEIMLVAEGFMDARLLARKFITLYSLCKELLSKQDHYDWGLRAIKSVLVVAGSLKRGDRHRPEDQVLMRALRDFNTPKIVIDDMPVFMGLIGDLFPALDVPRKRDPDFEKNIKQATLDLRLQPEDNFILKVVQLQELFEVRHSVFILGNAGTGKSCVWKALRQTNRTLGKKPIAIDLDPKSVTNDELFGIISPATREWKDGLFSVIMRDLANMSGDGPKWIVLDGDIDPMWIESLNTVMDDNKVLTLASNERITMTPSMRLLFEISNLRTATPATVSRAGILFLNPNDLGWNPYVQSWIDKRDKQTEKSNLPILFDKYVPHILDTLRGRFKKITPIAEIAHVQMLTYLLECLLKEENVPADAPKELYEIYFVFCCVWAFGGSMFQDQLTDHRVEFNKWWVTEFKTIKFPSHGTVFDYFIDNNSRSFKPWTSLVPPFEFDPDLPLQATIVHTAETIRLRFFIDMLISTRIPVMLVGGAGTGKTVLMQNKLQSLSDDYMIANVPFNFYTTSEMLQNILEKPLEKKAGRNYGPPGTRKLVYFVDDMNMPEVDKYFTVQPHTLVRACIDHAHWYDRQKLTLKEIHNTQFVSCMNPTAGSFTIDARLQRHFCVFALSLPTKDALAAIYSGIFSQHMVTKNFNNIVQRYCSILVQGAIAFQTKMCSSFLPTAIKFHYIFNLRDMSNIFQGMLFASADACKTTLQLVRLYFHEANRVYRDKLVDRNDIELYDKIQVDILKKNFEDQKEELVMEKPLICCHFSNGLGDSVYDFIKDWPTINKILTDALDQYNELNAVMNLVLFEDAMSHVCRINRILESPRGNALLIGVGGSGKQSLSRLASFLSALDVFQITLSKAYGIPDLKNDLNSLYKKSGLKGLGVVFLMSDAQVANETFLVLINDLLASGEIPDLLVDDEVEEVMAAMMSECKQAGIQDTRENAWQLFIDRVRRYLKVVLCFSPVGSTLRVRSRKFPAVTNCTSINWFHEWPEEALISVSRRFLGDNELLSPELKDSVSQFMAFVHSSVNESSIAYLKNEQRYNYTTPKSFLELIKLYQNLLRKKNDELQASIVRLENGLEKLRNTSSQVDDLKSKLASQEVELAAKNKEANDLIVLVSGETEKVTAEKVVADAEEEKVSIIAVEVEAKASDCQRDLAKAEPALLAAKEALNTLNKNNLTELKSFGSPPGAVTNVISAVMVLLAPGGNVPKDRSWKAAKSTIMAKVDHFLDALIYYDKDNIPVTCQQAVAPYLKDPEFDPDYIKAKSSAAAGLCSWVINIMRYYEVFCEVEPKRLALNKANSELKAAQDKLVTIKGKVAQLESTLRECQSALNKAVDTKQKCQDQADMTAATIELANRLVGGLASENVRWAEAIRQFNTSAKSLPGDVLLVSAYISYVGSFTKAYRVDLLEKKWMPYLKKLKNPIDIMENLDPLMMLVDGAQIATWNNEGLPGDRMSMENATILTSCERWPLMIDPQLQGYKWIKTKYGSLLKIVRLGAQGYLDRIEKAIELGDVLLMENIGESVDAVLDHLLGRNTIKKGKAIKIGDKEISYHKDFKLILQTKLANPHYKPEMQAQTTLINFTVTRDGLEDQLLGAVVSKERPDLEKLKLDLTRQQNEFKIVLKDLEDNLLARLSTAEGNFLGDYALVENLETTKRTAAEIEVKAAEAKITEEQINNARESYRPAAARASILYFSMNDLVKINPMYQFSLKAFSVVFEKAIDRAESADTEGERVVNLLDCITYSVFVYTSRGLFERDKLIFGTLMTFQVLGQMKMLDMDSLDFLLRYPATSDQRSPVDFLTDLGWGGIKVLSDKDSFKNLDKDIVGSAKRWKKFVEGEAPEKEKFPQEWKNKTPLEKLCMMRALRPDRMSNAVMEYIEEAMGRKYVENRALEFSKSFEESGPATPMFFILSPGVDPLKDVEKLGKKLGYTTTKENFHNISLGQGQEMVAERAIDLAAKKGHWVVLQNVHLVARWLPNLEKKLEQYSENSHLNYRLFISAEPSASRETHIMPQGILESSIKITNEPPTGMFANLHKALDNFTQDTLEMCSKEIEFKAILFCLCYFHAVVCERRKFGAQGWNRVYPFNVGDLTISVNVLYNYLEANIKVPWEDLRYLFGEIMYGGHITDDWDRKLCRTYLEVYMNNDMFESELLLAPGYPVPHNMDYDGFHAYIDDELPPESPYLYGLHPNAEIEFLSKRSENLLRTVFEQQPRDASSESGESVSREDKVKDILDDLTERLPDPFNMEEIMSKVPPDERTPYVVVAFQECERMNILTNEIRRSLKELHLGLKGELTITSAMEDLSNALFMNTVPERWEKKAYPSLFMLAQWYSDMLHRARELDAWVADFAMPSCAWLGGFFNPQSFLTAIMQQMARKNEWPLDRMCLQCDVTKKSKEEMTSAPREGAYIHGLYMEGARWDLQTGFMAESFLKELAPKMPVIYLKAIPVDRMDQRLVYECPVYKTKLRGPTFVWTFRLKTKWEPSKWILGGVALLLQV